MLRDALCVGADDGGIRPIGGEATAPEPLFAATVKDLVVGREKPDRACGGDLELYARAAELAPGDAPLLVAVPISSFVWAVVATAP